MCVFVVHLVFESPHELFPPTLFPHIHLHNFAFIIVQGRIFFFLGGGGGGGGAPPLDMLLFTEVCSTLTAFL